MDERDSDHLTGESCDIPEQRGISRRTLLGTALAGAAAIPVASRAASQATPVATPIATPAPEPTVIPASAADSWDEPWTWRAGDWPGQQLDLNVVENEDPGAVVGYGNISAVLFSYNGGTPGPTIRVRGDETLLVRLRNLLGENHGSTYVGPYPDPAGLPKWVPIEKVNAKSARLGNLRQDFCLGEHTNGVHSARTTNIHTHGLHVRPGRNPDGTHSDNVILRLLSQGDLDRREDEVESAACSWLRNPEQNGFLRDDETTGYADYEFRLGNVQETLREEQGLPPQPHPPGTHWYHPHCHGSTHNQVSSGMAGFLIIEGDVDEAINLALTREPHPDPQEKTGDYDYIERCMFMQRVFVASQDPDAPTKSLKRGGGGPNPAINGDETPMTIAMRPGAIERWRVLNGSVDGRGYKRFMTLKGQYAIDEYPDPNVFGGVSSTLVKLRDARTGTFTPATRAEVSADKQQLYQLGFDGVTLVEGDGDNAAYTIRDLARQNPGTESPLNRELTGNPNQAMLQNVEACFADADSVRNAFVRPNEVYLAPGNRTDLFFQAPRPESTDGEIYTVLARAAILQSDGYQNALQGSYTALDLVPAPQDIVVAYIVVTDDADAPPIPDYNVLGLVDKLPPVPEYLRPIDDDEVRIKPASGDTAADPDAAIADREGGFRTRTITYSGWGAADFPLVTTVGDSETATRFREFIKRDQANGGELELLRYARIKDTADYVLLSPSIRTMAISGFTSDEVIDPSDPLFPITADMARKFNPTDAHRPIMLEDTAEEWALYNYSISLWADTSEQPAGQSGAHYPGQPLLRAEGQARFAAQPDNGKTWRLQTKSVDHPFHLHQNPYWVTRIEIPDENGNLVNILDRPRWQDVVWIPRNGGRVVFRSRFPDFVGAYVNHCHILLHEDNGMMQAVEITPFADMANYDVKDQVARSGDSPEAVSKIYPRLDQARAWLQSMQFIDPDPMTGQKFPGFVPGPPPG